MEEKKANGPYGRFNLEISTGKLAKQANGSVVVKLNENILLVTAVASKTKKEGQDFFPLTVDYREKYFATGKIPGGFFKREGKPRDREILASRLIDRPIRPLFPDDFINETQIIATLFSADGKIDTDVLGVIGASAALMISDIPFNGPVGACRVALVDGQLIDSPTFDELEDADLELVLAGTETTVTTIEASANEVSEEDMLRAIEFGHNIIRESINIQKQLIEQIEVKKMEYEPFIIPQDLKDKIKEMTTERLKVLNNIFEKQKRNQEFEKLIKEVVENLKEEYEDFVNVIPSLIEDNRKEMIRERILKEGIRLDGRKTKEIRKISCEVGLMPRTHGSALFTRGETQSLACLTLGTSSDEQVIEDLEGESKKSFMLHYNFPPFSVGEVSPLKGPGRREIGHGFLAEKSLQAVIPSEEIFPYTIRIVSEILESNGSSSMASVCSGSLSLMDAGVPIKCHVAGIAMGLIVEEGYDPVILSDIMGEEDHYGDMDFKVAGTREGITGLQLDTKIEGITIDILRKGFYQAKEGREHILDIMEKTISKPREQLSQYAPRLIQFTIDKDKIGLVIGPGGKMIRSIIEKTGVKVDIDDTGKVTIASTDLASGDEAKRMIESLVKDIEMGEIYEGKVTKITNFGAFIELLPGKEALMHISQFSHERINDLNEHLKVGDKVSVKVINVDENGKVNVSRKVLIENKNQDQNKNEEKHHYRKFGRKDYRRDGS
ncbi:MAG: polyribonucleotide nucleotidyltransferase [candidate division WOR-3 bacterium]